MAKVVVVTGASAGVGRATVEEFAKHGYDVALLARDPDRLERVAAELRSVHGVRTLAIPTDVADADAVEAAATKVEAELGPIDVWVNVAMATVFAPVSKLTAQEVERGTRVTYLGQVHGMMAALSRMRVHNHGTIVNVGSALAYRSVPLQAIYCGAKAAIRGFTNSLRSEIIHDRLAVHLTTVDLPAVNTPQFDWAMNKMGVKAKPVAPIFEPEVPPAPSISPRQTSAAKFGSAFRRSRPFLPTASLPGLSTDTWHPPDTMGNSPMRRYRQTRPPTCSRPFRGITARMAASTISPSYGAGKCSPTGIALHSGRLPGSG